MPLDVRLYTCADAREDMKDNGLSGAQASLRKWESILSALGSISDEACQACGLCIEHPECSDCPLLLLSREGNAGCIMEFDEFQDQLDEAKSAADKIVELIKKCLGKEAS